MAAITTIVKPGPSVLLGNAVGRAIIMERFRIPAAAAGDTQTLVSTDIEEVLAVVGNVSYTALSVNPNGVSIPVTLLDTVAASNFADVLVIGYARRVHSGGAV
jgi:hypothetical protein